jgi:hypothetical protein
VSFLSRKPRATQMQDRRRAPRIELKQGTAKVDSKTFPLKNLSTTGFLLTPYQGDLIAHQRVYLTLLLPIDGAERDFLTDAQVVRLDANTLAGRFNNLRPDARRTIERLLAKR